MSNNKLTTRFQFLLSYTENFVKCADIKPINDSTQRITLASRYPMTKVEAYIYARYLVNKAYPYTEYVPRSLSFAVQEDSDLRRMTARNDCAIILTHIRKDEWLTDEAVDIDEIYPIGYIRGYAHRKGLSGQNKEYSRATGYDVDIDFPSIPQMYSLSPADDIYITYPLEPTTGELDLRYENKVPNLVLKYQPMIHALWQKMKKDDIVQNFKDGHSYAIYPTDVTYIDTQGDTITAPICSLSKAMISKWLITNVEMNS